MISFPNAKINIGLYITGIRPDGYHNLETLFYPIGIEDSLEVVPSENIEDYNLICYGEEIEGEIKDNLIIRAYKIIQADYKIHPINIALYKNIPSGAGLGGGSSDAAYMLKILNNLFSLHLSEMTLEKYATKLGADCAFFIHNKPLFAKGIGNIFTPTSFSLKGYRIVIVKPNIFVSTSKAFSNITPQKPKYNLKESIELPIKEWPKYIFNDFETSVFPLYPELFSIKNKLYEEGALYASMTGSGSSLFGIFPKDIIPDSSSFKDMFFYTSLL